VAEGPTGTLDPDDPNYDPNEAAEVVEKKVKKKKKKVAQKTASTSTTTEKKEEKTKKKEKEVPAASSSASTSSSVSSSMTTPVPASIFASSSSVAPSSSASSSSDSGRKIWVNYEDLWTKVTLTNVNDIDDLRQLLNRELKLDVFPSRILLKTQDGKNLDQEDAPVPDGFTSKATALVISLKPEKKSKDIPTEPKEKKKEIKENDEAKETPGDDSKESKEVKGLNSVGVSFDEKSEKYVQLDKDGKDKVKLFVNQIEDLRGVLERKRNERAPLQTAKDEALKKIRQIFEKLKEEKKEITQSSSAIASVTRE